MEDMIPVENTVIAMTRLGYIKRMTIDNFRNQQRGGKGIKGMQTIEDDNIERLFMATTHHYLMFFTNMGRVYRMKAYEIPESSRISRGTAIVNLLQLMPDEKISAVISIDEYKDDEYLIMANKSGIIKKTSIKDYANIRRNGLQAITLREDDELIEVKVTSGEEDILLVTRHGQCIRFKEKDVRTTGRTSIGVRGMNLESGDEVVAMQTSAQGENILLVSEFGMGKRTNIEEFTTQHRGGKGVKCYKITEKTGNVVGAKIVEDGTEIMLITNEGIIIRIDVDGISKLGRVTSGVKLMSLDSTKEIKVAGISRVQEDDEEENEVENEND
jgi:DNA gyrase subunit A